MNFPLPWPHEWPWVSIHDVAPDTLERTESLASQVEVAGRRATLLVIPNAGWDEATLARLRALNARGHLLAGHGWTHRVQHWGNLRHRLHGWLISNHVAEHLAVDAAGCEQIIRDCYAWFAQHDLPEPVLYVPPAWAMGSIDRMRLKELPFRYYETLGGLYDAQQAQFVRIPVVGFEADRPWRARLLRLSNSFNRRLAQSNKWLRIAIHPWDLDGPLRDDLQQWLIPFENGLAQTPQS